MKHHLSTVGVAFSLLAIAATSAHSEDRGSWFKSLRQPVTGASCCDIADCRQTKADWQKGQWWADVQGEWTPIPKEKELAKTSIDGEAYVCSGYDRRIYCFVPPIMSM